MSRRSTITLALLAVGLLAVAWLDRGRVSQGEREARRGRLLEALVRERLQRVEIERPDAPRLVLVVERDQEGELGDWRLLEPVRAEADQEAVTELLSRLDWAEPRRRLQGVGPEERARFGLAPPRATVRLQVGEERLELRLGAEAPTGGRYAEVVGADEVVVVDEALWRAVSREAGHFRAKELLPDLPVERVERLRLAGEGGERSIERREGRWWLRRPFEALASRKRVSEALRALEELRAERFVEKETSEVGLQQPWLRLEIAWGGEEGGPGETKGGEAVLRVGASCPDAEGERYARVGEDGPLVCLREAALQPLLRPAEALRDERVVDVELIDLRAIEARASGAELVVERDEEAEEPGWRYRVDGERQQGRVGEGEVRALLRLLTGLQVARFEPRSEEAERRAGLRPPALELTFRFAPEAERPDERLRVGRGEGPDGSPWTWFRRDEEPLLLGVEGDLVPMLRPDPALLRDRRLLQVDEGRLHSVDLLPRGATDPVRLQRDGEGWRRVDGAARADVGSEVVLPLLRTLASLRAERFVAARDLAPLGLREPALRVTFGIGPEDEEAAGEPWFVTLSLGDAAPGGGRFARVEGLQGSQGEATFVLAEEHAEALQRALDALQAP